MCVAILGGTLLFLKSCVPQLWGPYLPPSVIRQITEDHTFCIGADEVPVWPGEPRQAQCSTVVVKPLAEGSVPNEESYTEVSKAICYKVAVEHPYWETMGQTRHEIRTAARTTYKVALLEDGVWNLFPDDDIQDRQRWSTYSCPTPAIEAPLQPSSSPAA